MLLAAVLCGRASLLCGVRIVRMLSSATERRDNAMGIRMEYDVVKLPDTYVTRETVYEYIKDPDAEKVEGKPHPRKRVERVREVKGGWLFTFMRGHQLRVETEEQMKLLNLSAHRRLIDDSTGLEVNEQGIPIDIQHLAPQALHDGGAPDTVASLAGRAHDADSDLDSLIEANKE